LGSALCNCSCSLSDFLYIIVNLLRQRDYVSSAFVFTEFRGEVEHGSRKKPLDFGGNLNDVTLGLGLGRLGLQLWLGPHGKICVMRPVFSSFVTPVALADVCTVVSVIDRSLKQP